MSAATRGKIVSYRCVGWSRVTNSVHQGSLWEGAVSQRLTEGESLGILDAAPNEALVVDQRSLLQSASRPAPSQREPLACTTRFGLPFIKPAKLQFGENICPANVGEDIILPRSGAFQSCTFLGEFVQTWTITHSTKHAVILRGGRLIASPTVA